MKYMCMLVTFLITGTIAGADFFYALINPAEKELRDRIQALPTELRKKIYFMVVDELTKQNKATIKKYIQESLKINDDKQTWYNIEQYFAFSKYGTKCIHVVAFYPKKDTPVYIGINTSTYASTGIRKLVGSSANIYWHTLKNENVNTFDCIEKRRQDEAPYNCNGIELRQRAIGSDQAFVVWHNESNFRESQIIKKDDSTCIMQ